MPNLLIGAASNIRAYEWLTGRLRAILSESTAEITIITGNALLEQAMSEVLVDANVLRIKPVKSRKAAQSALENTSHLLLFWDGREFTELIFEARALGIPTKVIPFRTTVAVNKDKGDRYDVYIGRGSPWGNPYVVGTQDGQYSRDEAVSLYKADFEKRISCDGEFKARVLSLRGYALACHCKPLSCHGDVICAYLNGLNPDSDA